MIVFGPFQTTPYVTAGDETPREDAVTCVAPVSSAVSTPFASNVATLTVCELCQTTGTST